MPNSRLSNLSGDKEKKSVSSRRGGSLRKGLTSTKSLPRKDPTPTQVKLRKKATSKSRADSYKSQRQNENYKPLRTANSVKNEENLGT